MANDAAGTPPGLPCFGNGAPNPRFRGPRETGRNVSLNVRLDATGSSLFVAVQQYRQYTGSISAVNLFHEVLARFGLDASYCLKIHNAGRVAQLLIRLRRRGVMARMRSTRLGVRNRTKRFRQP
jgi:hypothetical protein